MSLPCTGSQDPHIRPGTHPQSVSGSHYCLAISPWLWLLLTISLGRHLSVSLVCVPLLLSFTISVSLSPSVSVSSSPSLSRSPSLCLCQSLTLAPSLSPAVAGQGPGPRAQGGRQAELPQLVFHAPSPPPPPHPCWQGARQGCCSGISRHRLQPPDAATAGLASRHILS